MIRIWESFIRALQLPETGRRETTQGQSCSPRMLYTKVHPSRQNGEETLLEAPAILPGNTPAGWRGDRKSISLFSPSSSASPLLRLCFGTAGA